MLKQMSQIIKLSIKALINVNSLSICICTLGLLTSSISLTDSKALSQTNQSPTTIKGVEGKCLDVNAGSSNNGTQIQLWDCNGTNAQKLTFSNGMLYSGVASNKCLDIYEGNTANGAKVLLWDCHGGANQKWTFSNGVFYSAMNGNKCLDVNGANTANGTQIQLWDCNGTNAQFWAMGLQINPSFSGLFDSRGQQLVKDAIAKWQTIITKDIRQEVTNMNFEITSKPPTGSWSNPKHFGEAYPDDRSKIYLNPELFNYSDSYVQLIIMHEMGHALGLANTCPNGSCSGHFDIDGRAYTTGLMQFDPQAGSIAENQQMYDELTKLGYEINLIDIR
ncbi:RICIN domain-containing protein [Cyanobacteria bacterium FACHB-472]|nr:RICIN domain-containing protein [Cyanobacteria bacterium FACHB-472]